MSDDHTPDPAQLVLMPDGSMWEHITQGRRRPPVEPRARRTDPETSHQAAESMVEGAASQREAILRQLRQLGTGFPLNGATADELDEHIGWRATTAGRRLIELARHDPPLVERTTEKRRTRSGRWAYVWRVR